MVSCCVPTFAHTMHAGALIVELSLSLSLTFDCHARLILRREFFITITQAVGDEPTYSSTECKSIPPIAGPHLIVQPETFTTSTQGVGGESN